MSNLFHLLKLEINLINTPVMFYQRRACLLWNVFFIYLILKMLKFICVDISGSYVAFVLFNYINKCHWCLKLMAGFHVTIYQFLISVYKIYCAIDLTNMGHMGISFFVWFTVYADIQYKSSLPLTNKCFKWLWHCIAGILKAPRGNIKQWFPHLLNMQTSNHQLLWGDIPRDQEAYKNPSWILDQKSNL